MPASAATGPAVPGAAWTATLPYGAFPSVTPSGHVVASWCGAGPPTPSDPAVQSFNRAGSIDWSQPASLSSQCSQPVADPQGNAYLHGTALDGNSAIRSIDTSGNPRWSTPTTGFVPGGITPVLGPDSAYFSLFDGRSFKLLGLNRSTGSVTLDKPFGHITGLFTYANGLIVVDTDSVVNYLAFDGTIQNTYYASPAISAYVAYSSAADATGSVFLAGYNSICGSPVSVVKMDSTGLLWVWTDPNTYGCSQTVLAATPDQGVIVGRYTDAGNGGNSRVEFASLNVTGNLRWRHQVTQASLSVLQPLVDENGLVALPTQQYADCGRADGQFCMGARIEFVTEALDASALPTLDVFDPSQGEFLFQGAAIDNGRVYLARVPYGFQAIPPSISAFDVAGLGQDYRLSLVPGTPPPPRGFDLTLTAQPATQTVGDEVTLLATVRDNFGLPVQDTLVTFGVSAGPEAGTFAAIVRTDVAGTAKATIMGRTMGTDSVIAWLDSDIDGILDPQEDSALEDVVWLPPAVNDTSPIWAGYVLRDAPVRSLSAQVEVNQLGDRCTGQAMESYHWIGFNGFREKARSRYLPQIGFAANCVPNGGKGVCGTSPGPDYYVWYSLDPHKPIKIVCSTAVVPGDLVNLFILPQGKEVYFSISITHNDGSAGPTWSERFTVKKPYYSSMECISEAPTARGGRVPLANFGSVNFMGCSAIQNYAQGSSLTRLQMATTTKPPLPMAETSPISLTNNDWSKFTVTWKSSGVRAR